MLVPEPDISARRIDEAREQRRPENRKLHRERLEQTQRPRLGIGLDERGRVHLREAKPRQNILDVTLDTVKIRLHRARARINEKLRCNCRPYYNERGELMGEPKKT